MKYEDRVVAFVDFLGFKDIIEESEKSDVRLQKIIGALLMIREHFDLTGTTDELLRIENSKMVTQFSDSIVISFKINEISEVFYTLLDIQQLIIRLACRGYVCRGGISYGKMIHTSELVLGPAFNEAYRLESKVACSPRVILGSEIIKIGAQNHSPQHSSDIEEHYIRACTTEDADNFYYIDYFAKAFSELDDPEIDSIIYVETLKNIIEKGLSNHDKGVTQKYEWLRSKYRDMINDLGEDLQGMQL